MLIRPSIARSANSNSAGCVDCAPCCQAAVTARAGRHTLLNLALYPLHVCRLHGIPPLFPAPACHQVLYKELINGGTQDGLVEVGGLV